MTDAPKMLSADDVRAMLREACEKARHAKAAGEGRDEMSKPSYGPKFVVRYPFIHETYETVEEDGPVKEHSWKPGVRYEYCEPDDTEAVADGEGEMIMTVVASFKPGHFHERVFFTRRFVAPDGREFGKRKLHILTAEKFRRLARGYQFEYRVAKAVEVVP